MPPTYIPRIPVYLIHIYELQELDSYYVSTKKIILSISSYIKNTYNASYFHVLRTAIF